MCWHAAGIHPPAATEAAEAEAPRGIPKKEGKPSNTPKIYTFRKVSELLKDLSKAECLQISYSNYLGALQKLGLAILKAQHDFDLMSFTIAFT